MTSTRGPDEREGKTLPATLGTHGRSPSARPQDPAVGTTRQAVTRVRNPAPAIVEFLASLGSPAYAG
jgi:hypothetical protein